MHENFKRLPVRRMGNVEGSVPDLESIERQTDLNRDELQQLYLKFVKRVGTSVAKLTSVPTRLNDPERVLAVGPSSCWNH